MVADMMTFFIFIVLGVCTGALLYIPISSAGILVVLANLLHVRLDHRVFCFMLLGMFLAGALRCRMDIIRLLYSFKDAIQELFLRKSGNRHHDNYLILLKSLLISCIPLTVMAVLFGGITKFAYANLLAVSLGFLVTALILLVSSLMEAEKKGPKKLRLSDSILLGIFEGFSFLPGISKTASAEAAGFLCGMTNKFIVKLLRLLILHSMGITMLSHKIAPDFYGSPGSGWILCIVAGISSFIGTYLMTNRSRSFISRKSGLIFAALNFMLSVIVFILYNILK